MTKKWIAINLMLLVATVLLGRQLYVSALLFKQENSPANITRVQSGKKGAVDPGLPQVQPVKKFGDAEYAVIPAGNLFTETRRPEEKTEAPAPEPARRLDIPPVLVGIMISGSQRQAMVVDTAATSASGARRTQTMRIGDNFRGFVVTDITNNGMVLESGPSREVVPLFAAGKTPQSGKTPIVATKVVSFGPGQAGSAATAVASAVGGRTAPIQSPAPAAGARANQAANPAQQRGNTTPQQQGQGIQSPMQFSPGQYPNQYIDAQGRQVIQTPFGILPVQQQAAPPTQTPVKK
jgi:hypothetical protein